MQNIEEILEKVDPDLLKLMNASQDFSEYRKITSTSVSNDVLLSGSIGIQINPHKTLGVSIYSRT